MPVKSKVKISQNFVAFSEYMIFLLFRFSEIFLNISVFILNTLLKPFGVLLIEIVISANKEAFYWDDDYDDVNQR